MKINEIIKSKNLVIGASENPARYSNIAIHRLRGSDKETIAIGRREGQVLDVEIKKELESREDVDTVTLYLSPKNQDCYKEYIIALKPRRLIFNPGTENPDWYPALEKENIEAIEACTLVMLSTGEF
ncbi:MAG: putative CoA-binding protein [Saprospiraceae bacterium]|jgi:predicted CoA-binding protein